MFQDLEKNKNHLRSNILDLWKDPMDPYGNCKII